MHIRRFTATESFENIPNATHLTLLRSVPRWRCRFHARLFRHHHRRRCRTDGALAAAAADAGQHNCAVGAVIVRHQHGAIAAAARYGRHAADIAARAAVTIRIAARMRATVAVTSATDAAAANVAEQNVTNANIASAAAAAAADNDVVRQVAQQGGGGDGAVTADEACSATVATNSAASVAADHVADVTGFRCHVDDAARCRAAQRCRACRCQQCGARDADADAVAVARDTVATRYC